MSFRVNTNIPSITAQANLGRTTRAQSNVLAQLSSGKRINKAADDAAGLAISEKLRANIRSLQQANRNANDGVSLLQTAEGGLNEISNILIRLRELSIQSASDTVGNAERRFSDVEVQNLKQEIERISQVSEFNGLKLLNGQGEKYEFQIGINNNAFQDRINYNADETNASIASLGVDSLSVLTKQDSQTNLDRLDSALTKISAQRSDLGAIQNRLQSTSTNIEKTVENLTAANSRIRDTDFAETTARNTRNNILIQSGTSVLSQANAQPSVALKLFGG